MMKFYAKLLCVYFKHNHIEIPNDQGTFSTGAFDHFCLVVDMGDYELFIKRFDTKKLDYQTYCHEDMALKQIWLLDPNGVRVELNFI